MRRKHKNEQTVPWEEYYEKDFLTIAMKAFDDTVSVTWIDFKLSSLKCLT